MELYFSIPILRAAGLELYVPGCLCCRSRRTYALGVPVRMEQFFDQFQMHRLTSHRAAHDVVAISSSLPFIVDEPYCRVKQSSCAITFRNAGASKYAGSHICEMGVLTFLRALDAACNVDLHWMFSAVYLDLEDWIKARDLRLIYYLLTIDIDKQLESDPLFYILFWQLIPSRCHSVDICLGRKNRLLAVFSFVYLEK